MMGRKAVGNTYLEPRRSTRPPAAAAIQFLPPADSLKRHEVGFGFSIIFVQRCVSVSPHAVICEAASL